MHFLIYPVLKKTEASYSDKSHEKSVLHEKPIADFRRVCLLSRIVTRQVHSETSLR